MVVIEVAHGLYDKQGSTSKLITKVEGRAGSFYNHLNMLKDDWKLRYRITLEQALIKTQILCFFMFSSSQPWQRTGRNIFKV
jgi:hypothetical protein